MTAARTPAVGGTRDVRVPDAIARDYILLALRLDQHLSGTVDGYFGPADLKAQVDMAQLRPPARLADDAVALRDRLDTEVGEADRRHWLELQLTALETLARVRAGVSMPYLEQVTRCFAHAPARRDDAVFERAASALDSLLPGGGTLHARLAAEREQWVVAVDRIPGVVDALIGRYRERAAALFGLPPGEDLRVSLVRNQPWSGYNWYDGGYRSRVDLNLDLPIRLPALMGTVAHETYPGHHLEHATKEQVLVERLGRLESSILLINTPECLVSEGLANVGRDLAVSPDERADLLIELATLAGVPVAGDPETLREAAALLDAIAEHDGVLDAAVVNAALMRHEDGEPAAGVVDYLVETARFAPDRAVKQLEFIEHPLWRLYVHVYPEGEALIRRWLDAVPAGDRTARFARLLREPLTPPAIRGEADAAG